MTDNEIRALPNHVRAAFQRIDDSEFDSHPLVASARAHLAELRLIHVGLVAGVESLRAQRTKIEGQRDAARLQAVRLADARPQQITDLLLVGMDLAKDRQTVADIEKLYHFANAVDLAVPVFERIITQAIRPVRDSADRSHMAEEALRGLLDRLKLAEAERLAA